MKTDEDDPVTSLSVSTAPVVANEHDGKWWVREVQHRVEFVLDGDPLSQLLEGSGVDTIEYRVTPFEVGPSEAVAVLAGHIPFEDWLPDTQRIPLLVCTCGDLQCGALTVRLSRHDDQVQWSEWAWENHYEATKLLPSLPACQFPEGAYAEVLQDAQSLALTNNEPVTIIRVRRPSPWWRNLVREGLLHG